MRNVRFDQAADTLRNSPAHYAPSPDVLASLPPAVDLRGDGFPPVHAQGALNSCTAHVLAALLHHAMVKRAPGEAFEPSRLFIYYNQRDLRRQIGREHYGRRGAPVRMSDGIKSIRATGFCREAQWPYVEALADVKPPASLYEFAGRQRAHEYLNVAPDLIHVKACLAEGYPLACGIAMYESFLGAAVRLNGIVLPPAPDEMLRGGHAVALVGYDDARRHFIARNSFGPQWGDGGHCYLPYAFLGDPRCGFDFCIVRPACEGDSNCDDVKNTTGG